jgi:hypothetical protein
MRFHLLIGVLLSAQFALADTIYNNNFDAPPTVYPGVVHNFGGAGSPEWVYGFAGYGPTGNQFTGKFWRNILPVYPGEPTAQPTILTLANLPSHSHLDIGFLLALIDSWDGSGTYYNYQPDYFSVAIDGVRVLTASYDNAADDGVIESPAGIPIIVRQPIAFGNTGTNSYDSAYDFITSLELKNIPHSASSATITFFAHGAGWTGYSESWAVDNVQVHTSTLVPAPGDAVPLPGVAVGAGVLLAHAGLRRRR